MSCIVSNKVCDIFDFIGYDTAHKDKVQVVDCVRCVMLFHSRKLQRELGSRKCWYGERNEM